MNKEYNIYKSKSIQEPVTIVLARILQYFTKSVKFMNYK